jgi:hypothetical protein
VPDARLFLVHALDDARRAERARVVRLPAARRVERGAIQAHAEAAACECGDLRHAGRELRQVRVFVIESFGGAHG